MTIKKIEDELINPTDSIRKEEIIKFLRNNPGCSKEDLVRGVKNIVSKKTVIKILNELKEEELVVIKKDKPNSRSYELFLMEENILIVINKQLKEFKEEFKKFLEKIEAIIPQLILLPFTTKENKENNITMIIFYEQLPLFILKYLIQCLLLKSIVIWPKTIQKEEIRNKLNSFVFTEISKITSEYSNFYNTKLTKHNIYQVNYNPKVSEELAKLDNNILYFEFFLLNCNKKGISKEYGNVVDKLWSINSDVQEYLHPEARRYNLDYQYGKDDWRKYLYSYKQNIVRIDELEKIKEQLCDINTSDFL
jgi:hypothetical protein